MRVVFEESSVLRHAKLCAVCSQPMTYTTDAVISRRGEVPGEAAKKRVVSGGLSMRTRAARRRPTVPGTGELVWFAMSMGCGDHFCVEA